MSLIRTIGTLILSVCSLPLFAKSPSIDPPPASEASQPGWNVLGGSFLEKSPVDGFTFEWQYFMVHDQQKKFTGSIGYVLVDPRGHLGKISDGESKSKWKLPVSLMPSGASVAIAGRWADGSHFSNYERFPSGYKVSTDSKNFAAKDSEKQMFAVLTEESKVSALGGAFRLQGQTPDVAWDLLVTPDWADSGADQLNSPFGPLSGRDVGFLPGENWTVHMQWPRTQVEGTMTNLKTGERLPISGHGYRENSWGRWNFALDGWVFSVVSDKASKVQWAWQTYHKSKDMDWLDVSFDDQGRRQSLRLFAKENQLRWKLKDWTFDDEAHQCIPHAAEVVAQNDDYIIRAAYDLSGNNQRPMLSNATALTRIFVIMIHMPTIHGTIENRNTGEIVARFEGQGGGEFSTTRSIWNDISPANCENWGKRFEKEYAPVKGLEID